MPEIPSHSKWTWCTFFLAICMLLISTVGWAADGVVTKVESPTFAREEIEKLKVALGIAVGKPFDVKRTDEGIQSLFAQGKIQSLFVETYRSASGLRVVLRGAMLQRVRRYRFVNIDPEVLEDVKSKLNLVEGKPTDVHTLTLVKERLKSAYEALGFYFAEVEITAHEVTGTRDVDVEILVKPNAVTRVNKVEVTGGSKDENDRMREFVSFKKGERFGKVEAEDSVQKINRYLSANQYPTSKVEEVNLNFSVDKSQVDIQVVVKLNERYQFQFSGNTVFEDLQLRELLTEEVISQVDPSAKITELIENKYRAIGFHFVKVKAESNRRALDRVHELRFVISEGNKVIIDKLTFTGNDDFNKDQMTDMFYENAPGVLARGIYWEEGLKDAVAAVQRKLELMGYLKPSLTGPKAIFSEDKKGVQLFFDSEVGTRTFLTQIQIQGNDHFPREKLVEAMALKTGEPLNREKVEQAKKQLDEHYRSNGYIDIKINGPEGPDLLVLSRDRAQGEVRAVISEGKQYHVGKIHVEGNLKTKDKVILREMKLKVGEVYNPSLIQKSEEDISLLGLFSRVEILSFKSPVAPTEKDIRIIVKETKPGVGEVGLGAAYEDPRFRTRGFVGLAYRNMFGLNQTATFRNELTLPLSKGDTLVPFIEYSSVLGYRVPYIADLPFIFNAQMALDRYEVSIVGPSLLTRARIEGKIEKRFSPIFSGVYRLFRYERTTTEILSPYFSTQEIIGSTGPGIVLDFRNDIFNPTRGSYHTLDIEFATPILLSQPEISFIQVIQRNSIYIPLFSPFQLSAYLGFGYARSLFDGRALPQARILNDLSLGGQTTLRGFDLRQFFAPIGSTANPTEETGYYNARVEMSAGLFSNISSAVFVDVGQIFPNFTLDPSRRINLLTEVGVGLGIRYKTPVGPIVLDLAQGLGPDGGSIKFYFTVGTI